MRCMELWKLEGEYKSGGGSIEGKDGMMRS